RQPLPGAAQELRFPFSSARKAHDPAPGGRRSFEILRRAETVLHDSLGRDEKRITREGGDRSVGRIVAARRMQRKNLPERLPGRLGPLEKPAGRRTEVADGKGAGEAGDVKKEAGRTDGHDPAGVP